MTQIKNRGVSDILIAIVDGLKGFPEAINSVFPETQIQTCIVHLIRNSLDFCSWKDRKPVAKELKSLYRAEDAQAAAAALQEFEDGPWGQKFQALSPGSQKNDLYDQRHREPELNAAPRGSSSGAFPERRGGHEINLATIA